MHRYPSLFENITQGFDIGFPRITRTFAPPNSPSIEYNIATFNEIVNRELSCGRFLGPLSKDEVEELIGPFQTSPLSLIPKPHKPDKFRLIQNFSFPHTPTDSAASMNSFVNSDDFPCTWGTFNAVSLLFSQLPPGSQAAVRDVKEAYRTIPLHPSQWPGTVVRISNQDQFCIDTSASFGGAANCGVYGRCADAACDILRANGIGPVTKWVDDHVFIRIKSNLLAEYNKRHCQWRASILEEGGSKHSGGRLWFGGRTLPDGRTEEFPEDMRFPLKVLVEGEYPYNLSHIDEITDALGVPWELSKDQDFASSVVFAGLLWDLETYSVALPDSKRIKYLAAISAWQQQATFDLNDTQKLYGKLLHAALVVVEDV